MTPAHKGKPDKPSNSTMVSSRFRPPGKMILSRATAFNAGIPQGIALCTVALRHDKILPLHVALSEPVQNHRKHLTRINGSTKACIFPYERRFASAIQPAESGHVDPKSFDKLRVKPITTIWQSAVNSPPVEYFFFPKSLL